MKQSSMISIPALVPSSALNALLLSPTKKRAARKSLLLRRGAGVLTFWASLFVALGLLTMLALLSAFRPEDGTNCGHSALLGNPRAFSHSFQTSDSPAAAAAAADMNWTDGERDFWQQPDDEGYRPCLGFSPQYRGETRESQRRRRTYLLVVVSGGLNQQRNQIIDAVVIARILGASLVVPIMQVNVIWGDDSEFSDIFDVDHFKSSLKNDVRIVSSLPSTHIMTRPTEEKKTPLDASPVWFKAHYSKRLRKDGVLLLRGLDSRLSKDLPADLQKLRCKVAFHALRFAAPIQALGDEISRRMWSRGPYLALHLRLEKDVWVRTGCATGLGADYDQQITLERRLNPKLLTGRSNMTQQERQLAGLCPLTAKEIARLLKGLGATARTRIYWAGGEPFGGHHALEPLKTDFPNLYNKHDLASKSELESVQNRASKLAGVDYLVSLNSDVFMPSHGGNMGHSLKGHRAYTGHRKYITPNKREMLPFFLNGSLSEADFSSAMNELHRESMGQPAMWTDKKGRDVLGYPVSECMCRSGSTSNSSSNTSSIQSS